MALILAVNPGGSQNAALARLARELPGHELMGADSCAVAIAAVDRRLPDLVLLPSLPESEEAGLLARLHAVPGGVRLLNLPTLTSDNPRILADFADQVRESLAAPPAILPGSPDEHRAHLIAAAVALVGWVQARRATWTATGEADVEFEAAQQEVAAPKTVATPIAEPMREPIREPIPEPIDDRGAVPARRSGESGVAAAARIWRDWQEPILRWLPRVAALAIVAALGALALTYLPALRTSITSGELVLESGPAGSQVFIDGRLAGITPISVDLPAGQYSVEFRSGSLSRTSDVAVIARSRVVQRVDWLAAPTGSLRVRSDPAGARVFVDNVPRGITPLTVDTIAAGPHVVTLESAGGSVRRTVTIATGKTAELTESIYPGWLVAFAPFEIEISEGNALLRPDDRGRSMLSAGPHKLRFRNRDLGYDEVRTVEITPGDTTTLNLSPQTTIGVTATEPSEVWIDGKRVGQTPVAKLRINLGSRVVLVKPATGEERQFTVTATLKPVQIDVDFSKPQR